MKMEKSDLRVPETPPLITENKGGFHRYTFPHHQQEAEGARRIFEEEPC
jgi:hypothetical protein